MSNQSNDQLVRTMSGAIDVEYYNREANRLRSEFLLALITKAYRAVKSHLVALTQNNTCAANMFLLEKLAK
ncbi:MAG: hypothetical protein V7784_05645 [Oceanospirillaceae bacterium]